MKPHIHAESSARKYGGEATDYLAIHELLDCSKSSLGDNRHRAMCHNSWFIREILPKIFGMTRVNSTGKTYSVIDVAENHILEDLRGYGIPTIQDWLGEMPYRDWMHGDGPPPSAQALRKKTTNTFIPFREQNIEPAIMDGNLGGNSVEDMVFDGSLSRNELTTPPEVLAELIEGVKKANPEQFLFIRNATSD